MGKIKAIRSEADYNAALARIDTLMDAEPGTHEGEELDVLTDLVEHYEAKHVPIGFPSPGAAIEFRLQQTGATFSEPLEDLDWNRFPLKAMAKLGWIPAVPNLASRAKELMCDLIRRAGGPEVAGSMLYRKSNHGRANVKTEPYALKAW